MSLALFRTVRQGAVTASRTRYNSKVRSRTGSISAGFLVCALLAWAQSLSCGQRRAESYPDTPWTNHGGDKGSRKYSPIDQIKADNVNRLRVAWRWSSPDNEIVRQHPGLRPFIHEATPINPDGVLYTVTSLSQVAALDPRTGRSRWVFDPKSYLNPAPANVGFTNRGVAYWSGEGAKRIFVATGDAYLISVDAETGRPDPDFGDGGRVDLTLGLRRPVDRDEYGATSPPVVCKDVVVVGSSIPDTAIHKDASPGDVRGFDARTGRLLWTFHTIPQAGEFGNETWEQESWRYNGHLNVWSLMSADEELGYVYLPLGTPTDDYYGGQRLGDGLFGESLVCLDAGTGRRVWHYQFVHHGLWDYDLPAPPILVEIRIDGNLVEAVAQITKQGFVFVFDRRTGEPVWPIEERPVPVSRIPGERSSPTQPFPTKPPPFERQGFGRDDLIDFNPELRRQAEAILEGFDHGPLYTPPSERGTVNMPGNSGGGYWAGGSFDPASGFLFVPSISAPYVIAIEENGDHADFRYSVSRKVNIQLPYVDGLPLVKPPYSRITAIDLNRGEPVWEVPLGEGPRDHPLLKALDLPVLGSGGRGVTLATGALLFVGESQSIQRLIAGIRGEPVVDCCNNRPRFMALDKGSGRLLWETLLPSFPAGSPMTYAAGGKQYVVVAVGGIEAPAELVAFSLPD